MTSEQPATEPEATEAEQKPMTEEEEFQLRFKEEQAQEETRDKEIRYQLYKIQQPPFNLLKKDLEAHRRNPQCQLGIELTWICRKPFLYRNLSLGEYTKIAEESPDIPTLRKRVTMAVVLWPKLGNAESDLLRGLAGITQTITESCLRTSGFEEVLAFPV